MVLFLNGNRLEKKPHRPNHTKADGVKRKGREQYGSDMLIFVFMQTKCQHNGETRIIFLACSYISAEEKPRLIRHKKTNESRGDRQALYKPNQKPI
jgi:hypothetical protein